MISVTMLPLNQDLGRDRDGKRQRGLMVFERERVARIW